MIRSMRPACCNKRARCLPCRENNAVSAAEKYPDANSSTITNTGRTNSNESPLDGILGFHPLDLNLCYHAPSTKGRDLPQKILVLRLSSLGDVVLCSSFLRSLRDAFPAAQISFVVRADLADVAAALPGVTHVHAVDRDTGIGGLLRLATELANNGYSHVFDVHRSMRSRLLVHRMRHLQRPGFAKQSVARWFLIHLHRDLYARFGGARSLRQRMLQPLETMGLHPRLYPTQLMLSAQLKEEARRRLQNLADPDTQWIALAPGALWPSKEWPTDRFLAVAQQLLRVPQRRLLVVGGARERVMGTRLAEALAQRAVSVSGETNLLQTAALLQLCRLTITNDSGLLHVAEAVGCPVVALFGPTSPRFGYAPHLDESQLLYEPPRCSPCSKNGSRPCHRPTHECMLAIDSTRVLNAVESTLTRA